MSPPNAGTPGEDRPQPENPGTPEGAGGAGAPGPAEPEHRRDRDDPLDVEARWADIVADLGGEPDGSPAPVDPGVPGAGPASGTRQTHRGVAGLPRAPWVRDPAGPAPGPAPSVPGPAGPRDWPTSDEVEALEDEQSHFVPPEPPPLGGRDPLLTLAWTVAVVAPVALLVAAVLISPMPSALVAGAGLAFLAAVAVLVWRMPHRKDPDDHDRGAVV
ncbi:hypothetical protein [Cellulomonas sp. PhB143]|uniref:hypothetical protein n=1 Tax=Cellulomonas sp. PhB143 TaxID=2485186 RepID=UPI000F46ACD9|nr:hypothetical protein [Cellulomonas sp. PhB143]ROS73010.1 hypothetical protein EDF32_2712 [Cellulomonas sp. PhB143]